MRCEEIAQEGKPDRKLYSITQLGRDDLMAALDNPTPSHKVRSEFLATLFFSHLMSAEQIERVLTHRRQEIDQILEVLSDIDLSDSSRWPPGAVFVAGFGAAMAKACKDYIDENRSLLFESDTKPVRRASAAR